jgi:hypothetical protein
MSEEISQLQMDSRMTPLTEKEKADFDSMGVINENLLGPGEGNKGQVMELENKDAQQMSNEELLQQVENLCGMYMNNAQVIITEALKRLFRNYSQPERSKREDLKVNYKKENGISTTWLSLGESGYYPPPWQISEKNKDKTDGWCAFQDYYLRGCGALNTVETS